MATDPNNISADAETPADGAQPVAPRYRYASEPSAKKATRYRYSSDSSIKNLPRAAPTGGAVALAADPDLLNDAFVPLALDWIRIVIALIATLVCIIALYPSELIGLEEKWYTDAGWSHGFVVPLISIFLVWTKWDVLRALKPQGALVGLGVLLLGVTGQVLFRCTGNFHMSNLSIPVVLLGAVLFVFGWEYLKILWLPIGYLVFAIPLPDSLYARLTAPMQLIAAKVGVSFLPLLGCTARRDGTVIEILANTGQIKSLDVEDACSGMRMLVAFLALAVALAYTTARPMWQKVFLAVSAVPIAIFCNALRVTFTGVLVAKVGPEWGEGNAHSYFGLLMLIPAMGMQLALAWVLDRLFIETPEKPVAAGVAT